ncbi:MAG: response regulator [Patescibacteria group bacterium]
MAKKILVIEDDVFLGEVLMQKLRNEGFDATLAIDGRAGFDQIITFRPDLLLLDIMLPSMNGYEILEAKQKNPSIASIPVIIISNSGQPVEINRALSLGVKDYLIKAQIDPDEAIEKIRIELKKLDEKGPTITPPSSSPPPVSESNAPRGGMSIGSPSAGLTGKKIMWVEDDKFLKDIITMRLANEGCTLLHATDDTEATAILESHVPDIVLLDIMLPGVDGFEILRKLKMDDKTKHIPVVLLSNLGQKADLDRGKTLGAEKFLIKATVTLDEILDEVKQVIANHSPSK